MEIKHVCQSCGEVMAVHEHSSWQEVKDSLAGMRPLCSQCSGWPGRTVTKNADVDRR